MAVGTNLDKPVRLHHTTIQIGFLSTHPTHVLTVYRGILYCSRCGCRGISKLHNLARTCGEPKAAGMALLKAIKNTKLPCGVDAWPDPSDIHAGTTSVGHPEAEDVNSDRLFSEDEAVLQRLEADVDRIAFEQEAIDSLSISSGDPPAKRARCESGSEHELSSVSSDY